MKHSSIHWTLAALAVPLSLVACSTEASEKSDSDSAGTAAEEAAEDADTGLEELVEDVIEDNYQDEIDVSDETEQALQDDMAPPADSVYAIPVQTLEGEEAELAAYNGKVTLLVNTASQCGYTPQYEGLQQLHADLEERGFAVLGFPSNDFGGQEPGSAEEIRNFCTERYSVSFPMFAKVQTKPGEEQSPVYARLASLAGELPQWNFGKYLISKDGTRARYFPSKVGPDSEELRAAIEEELGG